MPLLRVRRHVAAAAVLLGALVGLAGTGTAVAAAPAAGPTTASTTAPPKATASPSPTGPPICVLCPSPSSSPTTRPTVRATATRATAPSPTPTPTRHRVRYTATPAPAPAPATTAPDTGSAPPVTGSVDLGRLAGVTGTPPTPSPLAVKQAASASTASRLARLGGLVLGAAVLLGLAGALGLYLTRHRHDH